MGLVNSLKFGSLIVHLIFFFFNPTQASIFSIRDPFNSRHPRAEILTRALKQQRLCRQPSMRLLWAFQLLLFKWITWRNSDTMRCWEVEISTVLVVWFVSPPPSFFLHTVMWWWSQSALWPGKSSQFHSGTRLRALAAKCSRGPA